MSRRPITPFGIECALARKAKRAGITQEEFVTARRTAYERSAKKGGWRASELAMSLADVVIAAEQTWSDQTSEG